MAILTGSCFMADSKLGFKLRCAKTCLICGVRFSMSSSDSAIILTSILPKLSQRKSIPISNLNSGN